MNPTDHALVAQIIAHDDRAAFGELVRRHQSAVRRFLRHLARGDYALADDVAQETFIRAWRNLSGWRGEAAFSTWLLGIAHNQFRNARRRTARSGGPPVADAPETACASPEHALALRHDLASALRQLDQDEQTALHLFYQQGLTHPEIAVITGWPAGTVKTRLARGKDKLRQLLAIWNPQT